MDTVLVRYGEIGLKGRNRPAFLRRLRRNIRAALAAEGIQAQVRPGDRRVLVYTERPYAALEPLSRVFGIASASPVISVAPSIEAIVEEAVSQASHEGLTSEGTFRIRARRMDKAFPVLSPEVERLVGTAVVERLGASVDLSNNAQVTIGIDVGRDAALIYSHTTRGPAGLPVGIEGRVVALLSGGLDSFVAAWMMMRRGCALIPVHMGIDPADSEVVLNQVALLQRYSAGWKLRPEMLDYRQVIEPYLRELRPPGELHFACVVCKRAMLARATAIATEREAHAIVTGDSLGQVASQTLRNLEAISYGVPYPIFRPLIGMDKADIAELSETIGTVPLVRSAAPCPFLPQNPSTRAPLEQFRALWERLSAVAEVA